MTSAADERVDAPAPRRSPPRLSRPVDGARGGRRDASARPTPATPVVARAALRFARWRRHAPLLGVAAAYVAAALVVPTMTAAAVSDDWVYARSVEILLREGELRVLDLSVVTLVFQVFWGALFALILGDSFGALRVSTVTLVGLSGLACYGLGRELGVGRGRSAFGAAAYLFNPLLMVLAFSFMTDPHFAALLTIASLGYVRGVRLGAGSAAGRAALLAGSVAAALGFLVRQQGALIPVAVLLALLSSRHLRPDRAGLAVGARIALVPGLTLVGYYLWLFFVHGVPELQTSFVRTIREAGWGESWLLTQRLVFVALMYVGLFTLPLLAAALPVLGRLVDSRSQLGWIGVGAWTAAILSGVFAFAAFGRDIPPMPLMPYVPQYVGPTGLAPIDVHGGRRWLIGWGVLEWLTAVSAVSSILYALALARRAGRAAGSLQARGAGGRGSRALPNDPTRIGAGVLASILVWQVIGALPPSFHFRNWIISVDRYLLPLLPLALCLGLWALRDVRLAMPIAWLGVVAIGTLAVVGTRDALVLQGAVWDMGRIALDLGIPIDRLDAGAAWDGYHLYEYSKANDIAPRTPGGPWWTDLFAPATDSTYVVSTAPLTGYDVMSQIPYSSWLDNRPTEIYLVRRAGTEGFP